jgi:hypothetical protein
MATAHETYTLTVANTAYEIIPELGGNGKDITIQNNNASASVLIGGVGVTASDYGFKLVPGAAISFNLDPKENVWAVSATALATVNIMRMNPEGSIIG